MKQYFINIDKRTDSSSTEGTYDAEGNYNYDHTWEEYTDFTVQGVYSKTSLLYDEVVASTEIITTGYLIVLANGDGDSAGHAKHREIEGVHLFESENLALLALYLIKRDSILQEYNSTVLKIKSDVQYVDINTTRWKDYCGGVDALHLYRVSIDSPIAELMQDITYMNIAEVELNIKKLEQLVYIEDEQKTLDQNLLTAHIRKPNKI